MNKRTQKLNMQTDLQKLCGYRDSLEAFKTNQDHKAATLAEELEAISECSLIVIGTFCNSQ